MNDEVERMIAGMDAALRDRPDYLWNRIGLAEAVAARGHRERAAGLAREVMALAVDDPATRMRGRRLLSPLLPGYHVPMMNDARRNAAWDAALRRAIRPGMLVLEIGTGAGMLALMAARAGARVVTCEMNPITAGMARELIARNGYADRITVVDGQSHRLDIGRQLDRLADMLICDIFGDELLDFDPLPAIADAQGRLLAPDAPVMPRAVSLRAALADWRDHSRAGRLDTACGFDLAPFGDFLPAALSRPVDTAGLTLLSDGVDLFRFVFGGTRFPASDRTSLVCPVQADGEVNTIVRWIRLDLDDQVSLEARPDPQGVFFSGLTLTPLAEPVPVAAGDPITIGAAHGRRSVTTWIDARCAG